MPTLAELRRQVRHKLMAMVDLEEPEQVPEEVLRGHCVLLATMVLDPSGVLTRTSSTDPTFVAQSDRILERAARDFAEELARLDEAYQDLYTAARARGVRGAALESWCATRVNTEFLGHPRPGARRGSDGLADAPGGPSPAATQKGHGPPDGIC
jgi:hypothetical protein